MHGKRVRAYTVGDRVRVWRKAGERARLGEVVEVAPDVVKVRMDADLAVKNVRRGLMDREISKARRIGQGVAMLAGAAAVFVLAILCTSGVLAVNWLVKDVVAVLGVGALYSVFLGIRALVDARDLLAPLPTFDPSADNSQVWVD